MKTGILKRFSSLLLMGAMLATLVPAFSALAADWDIVEDGDYNLVEVPSSFTSYFYRVGVEDSDENFGYGYGYGYSGGSTSYGYGYGYGYGYFKTLGNNGDLEAGDFYAGFFTSGGTLSASSTLPGVTSASSRSTVTTSVPLTLGSSTLSGSKVVIPTGTLLSVGSSSWDGSLTVTSTSESIPSTLSGILSGASNTNSVSVVAAANVNVTLDKAAVVKIPHSGFSSLVSAGTAKAFIASGSGSVHGVEACTSSQFTGDSTDADSIETASNYNLSAPPAVDSTGSFVGTHCYVFYNPTGTASDAVYIATRHFSDFAAGAVASSSSSSSTSSGGGGGGGSSSGAVTAAAIESGSKSPVENVETVENTTTTTYFDAEGKGLSVNNFADVKNLPKNDWKYKTVERVAPTGLFQGEDVDGQRYFNMASGMNRAMSAQVVARYVGCDLEEAPSSDPFSDVPKSAWYAPAVACLKDVGVVNGRTPTIYAPGDLVTRAEFFKLMTEAYLELNPGLATSWRAAMSSATAVFADVSASDWFSGYVNFAYEKGLLEGYVEGGKRYAKGNSTVMRIEAAKMVVNYLDL